MSPELKVSDESRICLRNTLFNHIDGISIGSTVFSLKKHCVFKELTTSESPLNASVLSQTTGAREGFFHVAMRLLAHQGFIQYTGATDTILDIISLTHEGREWLNFLDYYDQIPKISEMTQKLKEALANQRKGIPSDFFMPSVPSAIDPSSMAKRVSDHILGEMTAVIMTELYLDTQMRQLLMTGKSVSNHECLPDEHSVWKFIIEILRANNWVRDDSNGLSFSDMGLLALEWTPQYFYPVSYLCTFRRAPELIFGPEPIPLSYPSADLETHVDRRLDITFRGIVYRNICRNRLLGMVLPLFDSIPLEEQPQSIVDTGSGDGSLLLDIYSAVREKTLRGRSLKSFPLAIVGVEYNQAACEATGEALERAGIDLAFAIPGDIGNPEALAEHLSMIGLDPFNALHVSKSVLHNRVYTQPRNTDRLRRWKPLANSPFVSPDGKLIGPAEIECNLVELFEDWKPFVQRHGMVVIEAHAVDPGFTCLSAGRNIITCMEATHGYSGQYLMDYDAFLRAVSEAGYESRGFGALSGMSFGSPTLTINHFFPLKP